MEVNKKYLFRYFGFILTHLSISIVGPHINWYSNDSSWSPEEDKTTEGILGRRSQLAKQVKVYQRRRISSQIRHCIRGTSSCPVYLTIGHTRVTSKASFIPTHSTFSSTHPLVASCRYGNQLDSRKNSASLRSWASKTDWPIFFKFDKVLLCLY